jgi:hypothetical protein
MPDRNVWDKLGTALSTVCHARGVSLHQSQAMQSLSRLSRGRLTGALRDCIWPKADLAKT